MMAEDQGEDPQWDLKYRSEEEMDFFTEMALHETERWMEAVTRQKFQYPDDPRKSLESGTLLCELLNCLRTGSVKKINQFSTPLAGLDNINIFLEVCRNTFGLTDAQLFDAGDLEDLSQRAIADECNQLKEENDRRLRNVAVTIYWLGRVASASNFEGPLLDFNAFSGLFEHHHVNLIPEKTSVYSSYWENNKRVQSNHSSKPGTIHEENAQRDHEDQHAGDSSYESIGSKGSDDSQSVGSIDGMLVKSDMYHLGGSMSSLNKANKVYSGNLDNDMYQSSPNIYQGSHRSSPSVDSTDSVGGHSRQSSGSTENYPTRPGVQRTTSVSVDPLQFIKPKENALAKHAEQLLKIASENKEAKAPVVLEKEEDWQSNLKSWKSRRRQSYHRSFDQEESKDEPVRRSVKTYKEMVAEREKRRSLRIPCYADEEWQNDGRNSLSTSDDNKRSSFSSESGNSTGGHRDDDVFDDRKSQIPYPADNRVEKQEVNNNNNINSNNSNNIVNNNYNIENSHKETILQPTSVSENLISKKLNIQESIPESNDSPPPDLQPQVVPETMPPARSERLNSRSDKGSKVDTFDAQEEWVQIEGEDFVERTIKISQRLKSAKGFGFIIKGGIDQKMPITVHRIQLGGAADVCELRCQDIIMSINKTDVRQFTQQKVQQLIDKATQLGTIELRVRRYFRGGAANNDDMDFLSEEELEPEPEHIPRSQRRKNPPEILNSAIPEQPLPPPPTNEPQINEVPRISPIVQTRFPDVVPPPVSSVPPPVSTVPPSSVLITDHQATEEILPPPPPTPITVDEYDITPPTPPPTAIINDYKIQAPEPLQQLVNTPEQINDLPDSNELGTPVVRGDIQPSVTNAQFFIPDNDPTPVVHQQISSSESVEPSSVNQPPALLLRWQSRNRLEENKTPTESVKMEPDSPASAGPSPPQEQPRRRSFLQNDKLYRLDTTRRRSDNRFIVKDIRQILEKDSTSVVLTSVDTKSPKTSVVNSVPVQPAPQRQTEVSTSHIDVKSSPLVIQIPVQNNSDSLLQIDLNNQQLIQPEPGNGTNHLPEYVFNVDLNKKPVENELRSQIIISAESSINTKTEEENQLEETKNEELRIAEENTIAEERRLIEEEKQKRLEEERLRQEAEEKKRLEKKKEQIRMEEEELSRKKREIELAQQEIEENRRRLQQEQQMIEEKKRLQDEQLRMKEEQLKKDEQLRLQQQQEQMRLLEEEKVRLKQLQKQIVVPVQAPVQSSVQIPVQAPQRYQPPTQPYQPAVNAEPSKFSQNYQYHQNHSTSPRNSGVSTKPYSTVQLTHVKKPVLSGKMESVISRFDKPEEEVRTSQKLTREDLLAMNRKATPLQQKPEISPTSSQRMSPISREPPSKTELHSLNAVPKAKRRDPKEWIVSDRINESDRKPVNKSQAFRPFVSRQQEIQSSSQVHWVIEEAERRRNAEMRNPQYKVPLHDDYSKQANYPIQPADGPNIWRDVSAAQQKGSSNQLPKTPAHDRVPKGSPNGSVRPSASLERLNQTNPRASYASYGSSSVSPRSLGSPSNVRTPDSYGDNNTTSEGYESLSSAVDSVSPRSSASLSNQTIDSNSNTMLVSHQRDDSTSSKHSGKSLASSSSDLNEQVAVCGTEKCSHCSQELGFGAAMVIESLSLYYHVKCFRCCVCSIQLGNGSQGADVRVRGHKLHCHNCYSNDEALNNSLQSIHFLTADSMAVMTTLH